MKKTGLVIGVLIISISVFGQSKKQQIEELKKINEKLKIRNEQCEKGARIAQSNLTKAIEIEQEFRSKIELYKQKGNQKDEKIEELKMKNERLKMEVDSLKKLLVKKQKPAKSNNQFSMNNSPFGNSFGNGGNGSGPGDGDISYGNAGNSTNNLFISSVTSKHARKIKGPSGYTWDKPRTKTALYFLEVIADREGHVLMVLPFEGRSNLTTDDPEVLEYIKKTIKFFPSPEGEKLYPQKIKVHIAKTN